MGQQDLSIGDLVASIERGDIRLPEMQRQYVWTKTRVRDLLDSLYRGYPSGTILTWETDEDVATRDLAVASETPIKRSFQLLLDGQQRLTSLSAILRGEPVHVNNRTRPIEILFNLEHPDNLEEVTEVYEDSEDDDTVDDPSEEIMDATEDEIIKRSNRMAFVVHSNKLAALPHWVSVTEVFKRDSYFDLIEKTGVTNLKDPLFQKYSKRLSTLQSIRKYNYRVHILGRDKSYEEVTEIYVRVNSRGAKLRGSDLALAQITAKWQGSLKIFEEFREICAEQDFDLDTAIHLRSLVVFTTDQSKFSSVGTISKQRLIDAWEKAKINMEFAINFLRSNVKIDNPALLSSPYIIITIAKYRNKYGVTLSPEEVDKLRYWVLNANLKGRYSRGSSETLLGEDLTIIRENKGLDGLIKQLKSQVGRLDVSVSDLENKNSRSAYFKTMFLAFRESKAKDWHSSLVISLKLSGTQHSLQSHHIFPQKLLKSKGIPVKKINDICNLTFICGDTNRNISDKEPAEYLPAIIEKIGEVELDKHCIPLDRNLWKLDAYEAFLEKRRELVAKRLNQFLGHDQEASET